MEDPRPWGEPRLEPHRAYPADHFAVAPAEELAPLAVEARVEHAKPLEHPFWEGEIGPHGRLVRAERAGVRPEGERPVGSLEPGGMPSGKTGTTSPPTTPILWAPSDEKGRNELPQPVGLDQDVVVGQHDDVAPGLPDGAVAPVVEALLGLEDATGEGAAPTNDATMSRVSSVELLSTTSSSHRSAGYACRTTPARVSLRNRERL